MRKIFLSAAVAAALSAPAWATELTILKHVGPGGWTGVGLHAEKNAGQNYDSVTVSTVSTPAEQPNDTPNAVTVINCSGGNCDPYTGAWSNAGLGTLITSSATIAPGAPEGASVGNIAHTGGLLEFSGGNNITAESLYTSAVDTGVEPFFTPGGIKIAAPLTANQVNLHGKLEIDTGGLLSSANPILLSTDKTKHPVYAAEPEVAKPQLVISDGGTLMADVRFEGDVYVKQHPDIHLSMGKMMGEPPSVGSEPTITGTIDVGTLVMFNAKLTPTLEMMNNAKLNPRSEPTNVEETFSDATATAALNNNDGYLYVSHISASGMNNMLDVSGLTGLTDGNYKIARFATETSNEEVSPSATNFLQLSETGCPGGKTCTLKPTTKIVTLEQVAAMKQPPSEIGAKVPVVAVNTAGNIDGANTNIKQAWIYYILNVATEGAGSPGDGSGAPVGGESAGAGGPASGGGGAGEGAGTGGSGEGSGAGTGGAGDSTDSTDSTDSADSTDDSTDDTPAAPSLHAALDAAALGEASTSADLATALRSDEDRFFARMGDLRAHDDAGAFVRIKLARVSASPSASKYQATAGADASRELEGARLFTGVFAAARGADGQLLGASTALRGYGAGAYASYVADNGAYIDALGSFMHFSAHGELASNSFNELYLRAEIGHELELSSAWRLAPSLGASFRHQGAWQLATGTRSLALAAHNTAAIEPGVHLHYRAEGFLARVGVRGVLSAARQKARYEDALVGANDSGEIVDRSGEYGRGSADFALARASRGYADVALSYRRGSVTFSVGASSSFAAPLAEQTLNITLRKEF